MQSKIQSKILYFFLISCLFLVSNCNYYYYQGTQLEGEKRFEEANIEYHRAYVSKPNNETFEKAYERTAKLTSKDLYLRYQKYLNEKKYKLAFNRLLRAKVLNPTSEEIKKELKKWYKVLLAGKISLQFKSLKKILPLADEMELVIRFNTPNQNIRLSAKVDNETGIFFVEDVLYNLPQDSLMFYSLNSIGVKMMRRSNAKLFTTQDFKNLINVRTPVITKITGSLKEQSGYQTSIRKNYPITLLETFKNELFWTPPRRIRYSVELKEDRVLVKSSINYIDFLPQLLYVNKKQRRIFLDFGHLQLKQSKINFPWAFKRIINKERIYYQQLEKNILLNPYFYYKEGNYPFIPVD